MKKLYLLLGCIIALAAGCSKDSSAPSPAGGSATNTGNNATPANNTASSKDISTQDVAQVISYAVSGTTSGMATQAENAARISSCVSIPCGTTKDTVISGRDSSWLQIKYNYNFNIARTSICNNGIQTGLNTSFNGTSGYSALIMSSADTTTANISVSGLDSASANYLLNGNYTLRGTQQSLINTQHYFNSVVTITSNNISISKASKKILSGTANVQYSGISATGKTASHTASLTFLGNNQATLVVDNGTPQTISW